MSTDPSPPVTLYGIPNCTSVKKARAWLAEKALAHAFHDFKKQGVPEAELDAWLAALGWQALLNRKGTTWRQLPAAEQAAVQDAASARALMLRQPSVIKRPVMDWGGAPQTGRYSVGFEPQQWPLARAQA